MFMKKVKFFSSPILKVLCCGQKYRFNIFYKNECGSLQKKYSLWYHCIMILKNKKLTKKKYYLIICWISSGLMKSPFEAVSIWSFSFNTAFDPTSWAMSQFNSGYMINSFLLLFFSFLHMIAVAIAPVMIRIMMMTTRVENTRSADSDKSSL